MLDVGRHRQEQEEAAREVKIQAAKAAGTWYGGRTWDTELVEKVLALERADYLTGAQAADLLDVTVHVVQNMALGRSHAGLNLSTTKKQVRRTRAQKEAILALIREGKSREEVNEALGENLTHQHFYYYKGKA